MRYPATKIARGDICAEVGVWKGEFSTEILGRQPRLLHLIDPWVQQGYKTMWYAIPQEEMDEIHDGVQQKFADNPTVKIHRNFSTDVEFSDEYFDWVYLDGNHTYVQVSKDLEYYLPLIKSGGYLCGDDYNWTSVDCPKGPKPAVNEFVGRHQFELDVSDNQYIIRIPE